MGMLKVGDKLEVTRNDYKPISIGTILTITKVINNRLFETNDPLNNLPGLLFWDNALTSGRLRLLTNSVTTSVNTNTVTQTNFKVGDILEWSKGNWWEIINDKGNDFEIKMIKASNYSCYSVGDIQIYRKSFFTLATPVVSNISSQYQIPIVKWTIGEKSIESNKKVCDDNIKLQNCECGAWACKDSGHSSWCKMYKPMWG